MPVHLPTILICAALLLLVGGIVYSLIRGRKKGRSCGCGGRRRRAFGNRPGEAGGGPPGGGGCSPSYWS